MKNVHLSRQRRDYPHPSSLPGFAGCLLPRTYKYASLLRISEALQPVGFADLYKSLQGGRLDVFDHPVKEDLSIFY